MLLNYLILYPIRYTMSATRELIDFVKTRREQLGLTQQDLSDRAGVGLRFIRDLEQGKESLRLDKVNQVLALFGHKMGPIKIKNRDVLILLLKSSFKSIQDNLSPQFHLIQLFHFVNDTVNHSDVVFKYSVNPILINKVKRRFVQVGNLQVSVQGIKLDHLFNKLNLV